MITNNKEQDIIKKSSLAPTALVSGGAGFIGSHLVESLLLKNVKVIVIDNFVTGKKAYLSSALDNPKFTLLEWDINEGIPKNIESVDYIFHLAGTECYPYVDTKVTLDSLLTSAVGTKNLLDLAKRSEAKFLLTSSLDVYEGLISSTNINTYFGQTESVEKKFSHAESKRFAEALVWEYCKKYKLNARIVRLPEVYGPRMDFFTGSEVGRLLKQILDSEDLTVFGDGLEKNLYIYITDAITGIMKAQFAENTEDSIFTLLNHEPITTLELTYLIKSLANRETHVIFKNAKIQNPLKNISDDLLEGHKNLKWNAKTDLKDGIIKTLKWYGYDFNLHNFKANQFIDKKKNSEKTTQISNLHLEEADSITQLHETASAQSVETINTIKIAPPLLPRKELVKNTYNNTNAPKMPTLPKLPSMQMQLPQIRFNAAFIPTWGGLLAFITSIAIFAVIPGIQTVYYAKQGKTNIEQAQNSAKALDLDKADQQSTEALENFTKSRESLNSIAWIFIATNQKNRFHTYAKALKIAEYGASAISKTAKATKPVTEIWDIVKPTSTKDFDEAQLIQTARYFDSAKEDLARAEAEIKTLDYKYIPDNMKAQLENTSNQIPQIKEILDIGGPMSQAVPELLGTKGTKKYLILFQNPNELRATGGFIGSYSVVTFEKGKIKDIVIDDIYNVDGLLDLNSYKVESYPPIKKYSKQDYLRIRDANWNPSFPESAKTITKLFNEANQSKFDGVFAIDIYVIKDMLKVTGPIFLTAYNEEVTADNVYERAQYHSEANYTNGSQQKRAFLTVLGGKLLETVFSMENEKVSGLMQELYNNLEKKHILVYTPNTPVTALISEKNWDGKVVATNGDYVYVVDSNVGANKADYYVNKSAKYNIKNPYRDGTLEASLALTYTNTSKNNTWPGGPYVNYMRVYVPAKSFLHKVTAKINDQEVVDLTKEAIVSNALDKQVFEIPVTVAPSTKMEIIFNYTLPSNVSLAKGETTYSLYWQKQPGTAEIPVEVNFEQPFGKSFMPSTEFTSGNTSADKNYKFTGNLLKDIHKTIKLN